MEIYLAWEKVVQLNRSFLMKPRNSSNINGLTFYYLLEISEAQRGSFERETFSCFKSSKSWIKRLIWLYNKKYVGLLVSMSLFGFLLLYVSVRREYFACAVYRHHCRWWAETFWFVHARYLRPLSIVSDLLA